MNEVEFIRNHLRVWIEMNFHTEEEVERVFNTIWEWVRRNPKELEEKVLSWPQVVRIVNQENKPDWQIPSF